MSQLIQYSNKFKKQYKKVRKNPRWRPIFTGRVPGDKKGRSPWNYIMDCFLEHREIPAYFYPYILTINQALKKQLKQKFNLSEHQKISVLELHFDGHNGDHLLVYYDNNHVTYLIAIGTHSDLFG